MKKTDFVSPRYILDKILYKAFTLKNPDAPWLTRGAVKILKSLLKPSDIGFEWGAGRSTIWFAKRIKHLTSIEYNMSWFDKVNAMIIEKSLNNVNLRLLSREGGELSEYVKVVEDVEGESLDFVLVDGRLREYCLIKAIPKIKRGGMLILDNAERLLPSSSTSPGAKHGLYKNCKVDVSLYLRDYRCIWTTNGLSDTAIYFKT